jgi:C4-dicarboxylate transporter, DctM subunit
MDSILLATLGFLGMFLLIFLHIPIGVAMAVAGFVGFGLLAGFRPAISLLATEPISALTSLDLAVIPLFLLMGSFASVSGLSANIYDVAHAFTGHRRGGLASATVLGCALFGAVCGSSLATAATMGRVALPEMKRRNYKPSIATGCIAAGGTLGILIPPSVIMVIYAFLAQVFIIDLFIAALFPALIAVSLYLIAIEIYVRIYPDAAPAGKRASWAERGAALRRGWGVIFVLAAVIGSIYGGICTVNEAAALGAGFTFIFTVARGRLNVNTFRTVLTETACNTAMIYLIICGASIFSYFVTATKVSDVMVRAISDLQVGPLVVILMLVILYLFLGSVFEVVSAMVITLPLVLPLVTSLGYHPVWWGIVLVMLVEIGMITPPIGMNVFVLHGIDRSVPLKTIFAGIVPFLCADTVRLTMVILFPVLCLWFLP